MKNIFMIVCFAVSISLQATTALEKNQIIWEKDNISVIAEVENSTTTPSKVFLSLTFINKSDQAISIIFPNNPMKMLKIDITDHDKKPIALTKYAMKEKESQLTSGSLFHKIEKEAKFNLKIDFEQYYVLQKTKSYSINISGALLQAGKELPFEIKKLEMKHNN